MIMIYNNIYSKWNHFNLNHFKYYILIQMHPYAIILSMYVEIDKQGHSQDVLHYYSILVLL